MLRWLIIIFLFLMDVVKASSSCPVGQLLPRACGTNKETLESVRSFQEEITQKNNKLLEDTSFQEIVAELRQQMPGLLKEEKHILKGSSQLYVFVSFSLGEKALLNLAREATHYGAILVLRGFRKGSFKQTAQALHKIILKTGQGVTIDPELFSLFQVRAVPTFILAKPFLLDTLEKKQTPLHDRVQGHISLAYALETFAKEGDLREEAKTLLERGSL